MQNLALLEPFRQGLIGMPVSQVWRGLGSALFIEFGVLQSSPRRRRDGSPTAGVGEFGLMIEWGWRIERQKSIVCGSSGDEELWKPVFEQLVGTRVVDLAVFGRLPEIDVWLSGSLHVVSFMTAEGEPAWALFDRRAEQSITLASEAGGLLVEHREKV